MGISFVSLRHEGFPTFCLCLTTGRHLGFRRNYGICEADGCSRTPPGAMLRRPFRYRRSFMYAAVRVSYKLYGGKRCILREGKRLGQECSGIMKNNPESVLCCLKSPVLVFLERYHHIFGFSFTADRHFQLIFHFRLLPRRLTQSAFAQKWRRPCAILYY